MLGGNSGFGEDFKQIISVLKILVFSSKKMEKDHQNSIIPGNGEINAKKVHVVQIDLT